MSIKPWQLQSTDSEAKVGVSVCFTLSFPYPIISMITEILLCLYNNKVNYLFLVISKRLVFR